MREYLFHRISGKISQIQHMFDLHGFTCVFVHDRLIFPDNFINTGTNRSVSEYCYVCHTDLLVLIANGFLISSTIPAFTYITAVHDGASVTRNQGQPFNFTAYNDKLQ